MNTEDFDPAALTSAQRALKENYIRAMAAYAFVQADRKREPILDKVLPWVVAKCVDHAAHFYAAEAGKNNAAFQAWLGRDPKVQKLIADLVEVGIM